MVSSHMESVIGQRNALPAAMHLQAGKNGFLEKRNVFARDEFLSVIAVRFFAAGKRPPRICGDQRIGCAKLTAVAAEDRDRVT